MTLKTETAERIASFLPGADVETMVAGDPCVAAVSVAVDALKAQVESMADAQAEGSNWRPYCTSVDRIVRPLIGESEISPA